MGQESKPPQYHETQVERSSTVLETDEEIRQALRSGRARTVTEAAVPTPAQAAAPPTAAATRSARPFRPTARPPVALLTVCDDGKTDGEVIRIRGPKYVIGRTEGDLRVPIDSRMSARHVEITHQTVAGQYRIVVTDLQSSHGMFVRVSRSALADRAEFLVGGGRYRFEAPTGSLETTAEYAPEMGATDATRGWDDGPGPFRPPAVTEMLGREIGNRVLLVKPEYWIGSDPTCQIARPDDPFCEPKHVRLVRVPNGTWQVEHSKTQNGLWIRMTQITVEATVHFQAGEQRFVLRVP